MRFFSLCVLLLAHLSNGLMTEPESLQHHAEYNRPPSEDNCDVNNGGCSHDCRMASNGQAMCSCPTGYHLRQDGHQCEQEPGTSCEFEEMRLSSDNLVNNNLAGKGPGTGRERMEWENVLTGPKGVPVNLRITTVSEYTPFDVKHNGMADGGEFAQLSITTNTNVVLDFAFYNGHTGKKINIDSVSFTAYDLDRQSVEGKAQESVEFCDADRFSVTARTTLKITEHKNGCAKFEAQEFGSFSNNPTTRAELTPRHMNHAVTAIFKNTTHFRATLAATPSNWHPNTRNFIFGLQGKFCPERRCKKPQERPLRHLEIRPIMDSSINSPGMYFQFKIEEAEEFFGTRAKWRFMGDYTLLNSCGETKPITIFRHGHTCDTHDPTLQCGRFQGEHANTHPEGDWNYEDFDGLPVRWLAFPPGEEPELRACVDVNIPEKHLKIWPIDEQERYIEDSMYFEFNIKDAEAFFKAEGKPNWKYARRNAPMYNSCGELEKVSIMRHATGCTTDGVKTQCGRITDDVRSGKHDYNYEQKASAGAYRWIAMPEDFLAANPDLAPEVDVGEAQFYCADGETATEREGCVCGNEHCKRHNTCKTGTCYKPREWCGIDKCEFGQICSKNSGECVWHASARQDNSEESLGGPAKKAAKRRSPKKGPTRSKPAGAARPGPAKKAAKRRSPKKGGSSRPNRSPPKKAAKRANPTGRPAKKARKQSEEAVGSSGVVEDFSSNLWIIAVILACGALGYYLGRRKQANQLAYEFLDEGEDKNAIQMTSY